MLFVPGLETAGQGDVPDAGGGSGGDLPLGVPHDPEERRHEDQRPDDGKAPRQDLGDRGGSDPLLPGPLGGRENLARRARYGRRRRRSASTVCEPCPPTPPRRVPSRGGACSLCPGAASLLEPLGPVRPVGGDLPGGRPDESEGGEEGAREREPERRLEEVRQRKDQTGDEDSRARGEGEGPAGEQGALPLREPLAPAVKATAVRGRQRNEERLHASDRRRRHSLGNPRASSIGPRQPTGLRRGAAVPAAGGLPRRASGGEDGGAGGTDELVRVRTARGADRVHGPLLFGSA